MKGKKEDDDNAQKPTNESTRVDHFANPSARVQLEQPLTNFRIQPEVKEEGREMKTDIIMISTYTMYVMYFVLFQSYIWWLWYLDEQFSILEMNNFNKQNWTDIDLFEVRI